jgi:hypothetical protein
VGAAMKASLYLFAILACTAFWLGVFLALA